MAPRIGFTMDALRDLEAGACEYDVRLVWKKDDRGVLGLLEQGKLTAQFSICSTRELRLLGLQFLELAAEIERDGRRERTEVLLP